MDLREIVRTLEEEIVLIKNQVYPDNLETTVWVNKRVEALENAIDIILSVH